MKKLFPLISFADQFISKFTQGELLKEGDKAPDFELLNQEGKKVSLQDYKGKKVALWFYPKANTPGCTLEACEFRDRYPSFTKLNTVLLGVSFDAPQANQAFREKYGFPFSLLSDESREMAIKYGACKKNTDKMASRIGYLIDEAGVIKKVYPSVHATRFPEQILKEVS